MILCHFFGRWPFTVKTLYYLEDLTQSLSEAKVRDWDYLAAINFYFFYIWWKTRKYDRSIKYLGKAQRAICKIMEDEIPKGIFTFDQVKEEDEETERESSVSKRLNKFRNKSRNVPQVKTVGASYYESSDSDDNSDCDLPQDQAQKYNHYENKNKGSKERQSRLSQLSKFNLFALIQLANAWLILKVQNDYERALQIWNEAIMSLKVLSKKIKSQIIAVDLIEHLVSQIIEFKTRDFENTVNLSSTELKLNTSEGIIESNNEEEVSPSKFIAISESIEALPAKFSNEENKQSIESKKAPCLLNPGEVINTKDFSLIMSITTLVPFIKSRVPRLSEFDVKVAKLNEKEFIRKQKKTQFSTKIFEANMDLRSEIYKFQEDNVEKSQIDQSQQAVQDTNEKDSIAILIDDKKECDNIMNNPELKQDECASISFYAKEPVITSKKQAKPHQLSVSQNQRVIKDQSDNKSIYICFDFLRIE